ncbi:SDR family oxidoreductase [Hydrogenophaga sp. 2FB]|uniref:SDR family oxidoreductase n=1 Tax=Hydrogenophaga sp. 2FB TaxID=2502187 RepID=UPI0010F65322|nr:SDR family oxidoreductase [Hydrogenophaga sp. 2FB]
MSGKILVLGAGGNVGRPLLKALRARGEAVKAASRSGAAVDGAEGVVFDIANPATHAAAFEGVDRAYVMLPAGNVQARALLMPVVDALIARKIKIVFQSVFGVDADDSIPYRQIELAIERAGVPFVILRPNWFADNFHTYWKAGVDHGVIAVPAAQGKTSFIDARDIAASAAAALTTERFDGKAFNLTGPEAVGYADAAALLSEVTGKPIVYQATDDDSFIAMLTGAGVPNDYASFLASIFHPVREGWTAAVTDHVQQLTGQAPRNLRRYALDHVADLTA